MDNDIAVVREGWVYIYGYVYICICIRIYLRM